MSEAENDMREQISFAVLVAMISEKDSLSLRFSERLYRRREEVNAAVELIMGLVIALLAASEERVRVLTEAKLPEHIVRRIILYRQMTGITPTLPWDQSNYDWLVCDLIDFALQATALSPTPSEPA